MPTEMQNIRAVSIGELIDVARNNFVAKIQQAADDPQRLLELHGLAKALAANVREWPHLAEELLIEHHPDLNVTIGETRYYIGVARKIKPRDPQRTFPVLADALAGDFDAINRCLASNCIKQGQTRKELEAVGESDLYDTLFVSEEVPEIREGKPTGRSRRELKSINPKFVTD